MKIAIHQPEHCPWLGFFHKMVKADYYVVLDNVQFEKNNFQNRNCFVDWKTGQKFWLTIPIRRNIDTLIKDVDVDNAMRWQKKYWGRLYDCYCKYPFFKQYTDELQRIINQDYKKIVNYNYDFIQFICRQLRIEVPLIKASGLHVEGEKSELILNICKKMKADVYISGQCGKKYLDENDFTQSNIRIEYQNFEHPTYNSKCFVPRLSVLDVLFNLGNEKTRELLWQK